LPETAGCLQERDAKGVDSDTKPGHLIPVQTGGGFDVAHSLKAEGFDASEDGTGRGTPLVPVAGAICKDSFSGGAGGRPEGAAAGHFVPVAIPGNVIGRKPENGGNGIGADDSGAMYTLTKTDIHGVLAFSAKDHGADAQLDLSPTPRAGGHSGSHANAGVMPAVAFESRFARNDRGAPSEVVPPLKAQSGETGKGDAAPLLLNAMQVRRLTPKETLRLQGFPDDYLDILYRGKPAADGPKYRAVGNSMATNVMRFIGERIQAVEAIPQEQEQAA
jgi:DNA (cytosine-5)-methyltransferase 1